VLVVGTTSELRQSVKRLRGRAASGGELLQAAADDGQGVNRRLLALAEREGLGRATTGGCMNRAQGGMTGGVITGRPTAAIHAVARLMSPPRHRRARRALGQRREPVPVIA